jgi:7-cyano-7-deazaguanine synthase
MNSTKKCVVLFSGGLDSTVLLKKCKEEFDEVLALNINYGSKHNDRERKSAISICKKLRLPLFLYDLPTNFVGQYDERGLYNPPGNLLSSNLLKLGGDVPEGHYEDKSMEATVVPYRNSIMLSLVAGFAESRGIGTIVIGNHLGDRAVYPDCRREYIQVFSEGIRLGGFLGMKILSPFIEMSKSDIAKLGMEIGAPVELSWTCYKGGRKHCGVCGSCVERYEAFQIAGYEDPVEYETIPNLKGKNNEKRTDTSEN